MSPERILNWVKVGAVGVGLVVAYKAVKAGGAAIDTAKEVITEDLNPNSTENVVYRAVSSPFESGSLGSSVYGGVQWVRNKIGLSSEYDYL